MGTHRSRTLHARVTVGIALLTTITSLLVASAAGAATPASRSAAHSSAATASYASVSKLLQPHVAKCLLPNGTYEPIIPCPYGYFQMNVTVAQSNAKLGARLRARVLVGSSFKVIKGYVADYYNPIVPSVTTLALVTCTSPTGYVDNGDLFQVGLASGDRCSIVASSVTMVAYRLTKAGQASIYYER